MAAEESQPHARRRGSDTGSRTPLVATGADEPNHEPWYAVRCLFRWRSPAADRPGCALYEERIVLLRARSIEEAMERGKGEAREYATTQEMDVLDFVEAFHLFDRKITDGSEIFSLLRESSLPPDVYVQRFFATGDERREES